VQEAAGDEAEMIFGAVHDPNLEGKLRVTVIATGFGEKVEDEPAPALKVVPVESEPIARPRLVSVIGGDPKPIARPLPEIGSVFTGRSHVEDLEIPTFIRRQMD
jgi:cell division protein FtsZ